MTALGVVAGVVGGSIVAMSLHGIEAAGNYQAALLQLSQTAGATAKQMDAMKASILQANLATGQTLNQTVSEYTAAIQHGMTAAQLLQRDPKTGMDTGQILADYAHVQQYYRRVNPEQSTTTAVQVAHMEGEYSPQGIARITESLNRLAFSSGAQQNQVLTQGGYFIQMGRRLGMSVDQTMKVLGDLSITGLLRGKGGAGIADILLGAAQAPAQDAFAQGKKGSALRELGLEDARGRSLIKGPHGTVNWDRLMSALERDSASLDRSKFVADLKASFGIPGARAALQLTSPAAVAQEKLLTAKSASIPNIEQMVQSTYSTWNGALNLFKSNFDTFLTYAWTPFVDRFGHTLLVLANAVGGYAKWANANPGASFVAMLATLGTGLLLVGTAATSMLAPIIQLPFALRGMAAASQQSAAEITAAMIEIKAANVGGGGLIPGYKTLKARPPATAAVAEAETVATRGRNFVEVGFDALMSVASARMLGVGKLLAPIGAWLAPIAEGAAGIGRFALTFGRLLVTVNPVSISLAAAAGAFALINYEMTHPEDWGRFVANIQNQIQYKLWPAVINGIVGMFSGIVKAVSSPAGGGGVIGAFATMLSAIAQLVFAVLSGVITMAGDIANPANWLKLPALLGADRDKMTADVKAQYDRMAAVRAAQDRINARAQAEYDRTRLHGGRAAAPPMPPNHGLPQFRMMGTPAQNANAASGKPIAYSAPVTININGGTHETNAALAQTIKKTIDAQNNRDVPRALRQNGGLSTTPWLPQGFVT